MSTKREGADHKMLIGRGATVQLVGANPHHLGTTEWLRSALRALAAYATAKRYSSNQAIAVASAVEQVRLTYTVCKGGSTGYLPVLASSAQLYRTELQLTRARRAEAVAFTALCNVLRGGWRKRIAKRTLF